MKIKELEAAVPCARTFQLNPKARYLVVLDASVGVDRAIELQQWLAHQNVNAVVFPADCKLFEIEL